MIKIIDGFKVKILRESKIPQMTQIDLSNLAGLAQCHISQIESGKNGNPKICTIARIAKVLNVPLAELLLEKTNCCD